MLPIHYYSRQGPTLSTAPHSPLVNPADWHRTTTSKLLPIDPHRIAMIVSGHSIVRWFMDEPHPVAYSQVAKHLIGHAVVF
jgi:hypothetical protein